METVREIIKRRDSATDQDVDDLFEGFADEVRMGEDPEDAIAEWFGLEPDYLWDEEVQRAIGLA
jgi:hypothetical protein